MRTEEIYFARLPDPGIDEETLRLARRLGAVCIAQPGICGAEAWRLAVGPGSP